MENYYHLLAEIIEKRTGIYFNEGKLTTLKIKFDQYIRNSAFKDIKELYNYIKNEAGDEFFESLLSIITVGHTYFFREREHFDMLVKDVRLKGIKKPLIWSSAASSGEEAYSIAISLLEAGINSFEILASDINPKALTKIKEGIYHKNKLSKVSYKVKKKYFLLGINKYEGYYRIKDFVKQYIRIKKHNLLDPLPEATKFNYIFCRNVMIYFDKPTQKRVVENLIKNLRADGYLFTGHCETLLGVSDKVESVISSIYTKR